MRYIGVLVGLAAALCGALLIRGAVVGRQASLGHAAKFGDVAVTQDAAIRWGVIQADAYGEDSPVLKDVSLDTLDNQLRKLNTLREDRDVPKEVLSDLTRPVWLVEMTGTFTPAHAPPPSIVGTVKPEKRVMFILVDAASGQKIGSGYVPTP